MKLSSGGCWRPKTFVAEQHKLMAELSKFDAEANRERWWQPVLAIAAAISGILGTAAFIARLIGP